jgi:radical SAM protein with 4Fe4S-binding SPASM domain
MGCIGFPAHPVWEVTTACNISCVHCHVRAGAGRAGDLSTAEGMRLLEGLAEVAEFRMVAFTGGKPLLRPDLFTLLSHARDLGFSSTIATNATLVDGLTARRLSDAGVVIAAVSLDGADPATHDRIRGVPGAYAAAMAGLQALKEAGILLHVNITVMEYNERALWEVAALADEIGAAILIIYQLVPVGRGEGIREAALDTDRTGHLVTTMAEVQRRSGLVVEPVASPQYWPFLLARAGITRGPLLRLAEFLFHGCAAGRGFVYIKPEGTVLACPFLDVPCGNVRDRPFYEIWRDSPVFFALREREHQLKGSCGECMYNRVCGGCRGRAYATTGDFLAADPSCFLHCGEKV